MKIIGDYHTHSEYSHGNGNIKKNVEAAKKIGLKEIAITDHGPRTHSIIPLGIKKPEVLLDIKEKIKQIQYEFPEIKILTGVEANIINEKGDLDVPADILDELDIVAAGFHLLIIPPDIKTAYRLIIDNKVVYKMLKNKREEIRRWNTEVVTNAVRKHSIDFITHPGYQLDIDTYALARVCAECGTYLEINSRHGQLTENFVKAASQTSAKFIINSDAHNPKAVGKLENGLNLVEKLDLDIDRIVNVVS